MFESGYGLRHSCQFQRPLVFALANLILSGLILFGPVLATPVLAETYFVGPGPVAADVDGSRARPWPSLSAAFGSGKMKSGDELRLLSGDYGDVDIAKAVFDRPVVIAPDTGADVHLTKLFIVRSRNLVFRDLRIWPVAPGKGHIVATDTHSAKIIFQGLDIRSRADANTYPGWDHNGWLTARRPGILIEGPENAILDSQFTGLSFAIAATGVRARIEGNDVRGFSGDGARVLGDGSIFTHNRIEDCVQIDDNHADGFQSWSRGLKGDPGKGAVHGLTIEANTIQEWANPTVSPLRCSLQGIGMFDGMYEDVSIVNNLIVVSAPHGISIAGGRRVKIMHNTVINSGVAHRKFPWIDVSPHKNGTPSKTVLISNNISTSLQYSRNPDLAITVTGNLLGTAPARIFNDPANGDLRPRPGGPAEGQGDPRAAVAVDLFGQKRDMRPDIGAIEFH